VPVHWSPESGVLTVERGPVTVLAGLGPAAVTVPLAGPAHLVLASDDRVRLDDAAVHLVPDSVAVTEPAA
jgi:hypothetical protein